MSWDNDDHWDFFSIITWVHHKLKFGVNHATGHAQVHKPEIADADCDYGFHITCWNGLPRKSNCSERCSMGLDEKVWRNGYGPCLRRRKGHGLCWRTAILRRFCTIQFGSSGDSVVYVRTTGVIRGHARECGRKEHRVCTDACACTWIQWGFPKMDASPFIIRFPIQAGKFWIIF